MARLRRLIGLGIVSSWCGELSRRHPWNSPSLILRIWRQPMLLWRSGLFFRNSTARWTKALMDSELIAGLLDQYRKINTLQRKLDLVQWHHATATILVSLLGVAHPQE